MRFGNFDQTGDFEKDFLQYKIELERRLRHLLRNIDISAIILGLASNRIVSTNATGRLNTISLLSNWIAGTSNQIVVADDGDGTVTLSLPQNIDTSADVEFDSIILDDLTASRMVYSDGSKKLQSIATLSSWIAGTSNQIVVTDDGDGSITLSIPNKQVTQFTGTDTVTVAQRGIIECNSSSAMTLNLPTISGNLGLCYSIVNIGTATATLDPNGTETINGSLTFDLYSGESINIYVSSTEWKEGG